MVNPIERKNNHQYFDLKSLEDLLQKGPSLEYLDLLVDHEGTTFSGTLFNIRTRWEVQNIKAFFIPGDAHDQLDVSWVEFGKPCEKFASLWRINDKKERILTKMIAQEDTKTSFVFKPGEIISGKYQICLEVNDPWRQVNLIPKDNTSNSLIFEIFFDPLEPQEKVMYVRTIFVDNPYNKGVKNPYNFDKSEYRIKIVSQVKNQQIPKDCDIDNLGGVLITPINENWFVGILEVNNQPRVSTHLDDTNPIKLEYDPKEKFVTSIEDRHGDGAMYCYSCKMLFWCQETLLEEKNIKHHKSYGPIEEFHIEWIEDY